MVLPMQQSASWTLDEMHALPEDGNRYELVHGTLLVTPAPRYAHQAIASELQEILAVYVRAKKLGRVHMPRSVIRIDGSETEPDIMVRPVPVKKPNDWEDAPLPLLVVEILSPKSRRGDQILKRSFYTEVGIPEYWIVDGEMRTIQVVRQGESDRVVGDTLKWNPRGASAALSIDVQALFRAALD